LDFHFIEIVLSCKMSVCVCVCLHLCSGPNSKDVMFRVNESGCNTYKVDYTPVMPGDILPRLVLSVVFNSGISHR